MATKDTNWLYLTRQDLDQYLRLKPEVAARLLPADEIAAQQDIKPFDWMEVDEQLVLKRRRHWFALVALILRWPAWVIGVPALVLGSLYVLGGMQSRLLGVPAGALLLAMVLWWVWCLIDWLNDYLAISSKRVVYREKVLWFRERRIETPLAKIQNVNTAQNLLGNLLGFGTLLIDTAATAGGERLTFTYLADPNAVQALVFEEVRQREAVDRPRTRLDIQQRLVAKFVPGVRPTIPKPVAPPSAGQQRAGQAGMLGRVYNATLGSLFWVERKTDDQVIWRKHRLRLLQRVWIQTTVALVAVVVYFLLRPAGPALLLGLLAFLVPLGVWWWWGWEDWRNDLYIVTNDRIIDTDRLPLGLRSTKTEAPFDRIQNVRYEQPTFWANLFGFGTVYIYTAGVEGRLDFYFVARPQSVQAEIFRRLAAYEEAKQQREQESTDLTEWFAAYDQIQNP
jgi:uncharacterized membrane protein YdbT with pleckstrin-like domain